MGPPWPDPLHAATPPDPVAELLRRIADVIDRRTPLPLGLAPASPTPAREPQRRTRPEPPPVPLDADGERRFEALRSWRRERARRDGLPPYVIAHDRSLRLVAREAPTTADALAAITGFGPAKAARYGTEVIAALAAAG